jgi:branched-chain amino acid transport system substrate-binding protein
MQRRTVIKTLAGAAAGLTFPGLALSQTGPIKIGLVTDYSGPYRDNCGPGEEYAVQMAIQDFHGGKVLGRPIEVLVADHLNKADVCSDITKRWLEVEKVDMLMPSGSSVAAITGHLMARDKGIITNITAPGAVNFTEKDCSPIGFHWKLDAYGYARSGVMAAGERAGKKWFIITTDNVFGLASAAVCTAAIQELGGQVLGQVKHPVNTTDFASFIAQAQASRADVVAFITAGTDLSRALKQAREFGVEGSGQYISTPALIYTDLLAAGLDTTQGIRFADGFYWDLNDATRTYSKRFFDKIGRMPADTQAHPYAAVTHYLQAVEAAKTTESKSVAARMRSQPITSGFYTNAAIRPNGRVVYDLALMRVKKPSESKGKYDLAEVVGKVPADKVFKPLAGTECKVS